MGAQTNLLGQDLEIFECDHCAYKGCDAEWFEIRKPESKFCGTKLPFCPRCGWEMRSERLGNLCPVNPRRGQEEGDSNGE